MKTKSNTNDLIKTLSSEMKPVTRLESPYRRFIKWVLAAFLSLGSGIFLLGINPHLFHSFLIFDFNLQTICLFFLALLSTLSAFLLSIPDKNKPLINLIPFITLALWGLALIFALIKIPTFTFDYGVVCIRDILLLSALPGIMLFLMLRQAAPLSPSKVGLFAMLGIAGLGAFGTQFVCRNGDPLHLLLWHFTPVLIIGILGILIGRFLLKWI